MTSILPRDWVLAIAFVLAGCPLLCWPADELTVTVKSHAPIVKPNIIVVLADDIGWMDWKVYNPDSKIPSPNIDQLAHEGMRFMDAHSTSALCAPSRYSMLTGNYPWRGRRPAGTWSWIRNSQILPGQKTIGNLMQEAGYRTAMVGKLHQGGDWFWKNGKPDFTRPMKFGPKDWGFDYSYLLLGGHQDPPYMFFENGRVAGDPNQVIPYAVGNYGRNGESMVLIPGPGLPGWDAEKVGEMEIQKCLAFIEKTSKKPFFLYLAADGSHSPYAPPKTILGTPVAGVTGISPRSDMVYEVDVLVGKLVDELKKDHLYDNTVIVVTSDNGANTEDLKYGQDSNRGLHGGKSYIWEGGHRVPLVVWWPGHIAPDKVSHQLIGIHDMVPTLVEIAGGKPTPDQMLDGVDFLPVLTGHRGDDQPLRSSLLIDSGYGRDSGSEDNQDSEIIETIELRHEMRRRWEKDSTLETPHSQSLVSNFFTIPKQDKWTSEDDKDILLADNRALTEAVKNSNSDGMSHALREGGWKLVFDMKSDSPVALYNLDNDLSEEHNIITDKSLESRIKEMTRDYHDLRASKRSTPPIN